MGKNSSKTLQQVDPTENTELFDQSGSVTYYRNKAGTEFEKYKVEGQRGSDFQNKYDFRIKNPSTYLVNAYYAKPVLNAFGCSSGDSYEVVTERIHRRLSDMKHLVSNQSLNATYRSLKGYQQLYKSSGMFLVLDSMIGLDKQNKIKVWFNSNFALNTKESQPVSYSMLPQVEQESALVDNIIDLISSKTQRNRVWGDFLEEKYSWGKIGFREAIQLAQKHCVRNNIVLEGSLGEKSDIQNWGSHQTKPKIALHHQIADQHASYNQNNLQKSDVVRNFSHREVQARTNYIPPSFSGIQNRNLHHHAQLPNNNYTQISSHAQIIDNRNQKPAPKNSNPTNILAIKNKIIGQAQKKTANPGIRNAGIFQNRPQSNYRPQSQPHSIPVRQQNLPNLRQYANNQRSITQTNAHFTHQGNQPIVRNISENAPHRIDISRQNSQNNNFDRKIRSQSISNQNGHTASTSMTPTVTFGGHKVSFGPPPVQQQPTINNINTFHNQQRVPSINQTNIRTNQPILQQIPPQALQKHISSNSNTNNQNSQPPAYNTNRQYPNPQQIRQQSKITATNAVQSVQTSGAILQKHSNQQIRQQGSVTQLNNNVRNVENKASEEYEQEEEELQADAKYQELYRNQEPVPDEKQHLFRHASQEQKDNSNIREITSQVIYLNQNNNPINEASEPPKTEIQKEKAAVESQFNNKYKLEDSYPFQESKPLNSQDEIVIENKQSKYDNNSKVASVESAHINTSHIQSKEVKNKTEYVRKQNSKLQSSKMSIKSSADLKGMISYKDLRDLLKSTRRKD